MTIAFKIERSLVSACLDEAYVEPGEDAVEALVQAVVHSVATNIYVTAGGVTAHLAAWQDPEHWSSDWDAAGVDDPRGFIASLNGGS